MSVTTGYDAAIRLNQMTGASETIGASRPSLLHGYDGLGLLAAGQSERLGATTGGTTTWYARGWDQELSRDQAGTVSWLVADRAGSVRAEYNTGGTLTSSLNYDPHGTPEGASTPADYGFAGEPHLASVGLVHLRARWLGTASGRFLTVDPFGGTPEQPQSLQPYAYAHNDPVGLRDPTGACVPGVCEEDGWRPDQPWSPAWPPERSAAPPPWARPDEPDQQWAAPPLADWMPEIRWCIPIGGWGLGLPAQVCVELRFRPSPGPEEPRKRLPDEEDKIPPKPKEPEERPKEPDPKEPERGPDPRPRQPPLPFPSDPGTQENQQLERQRVEDTARGQGCQPTELLFHYTSRDSAHEISLARSLRVTRQWRDYPRGAYATPIPPWRPGMTQRNLARIFYFNVDRQQRQDLSWYAAICNNEHQLPRFGPVAKKGFEVDPDQWVAPAAPGIRFVAINLVLIGPNPMPPGW